MSQARRALVTLTTVIAGVVGVGASTAFARSIAVPAAHEAGSNAVRTTANTPGPGYWLASRDGGVFSNGAADFHGSTGAISLSSPIVGIGGTPSGNGYWMVASDGGIFSFGDAHFFGSTGAITLNKPIVGMTSTPSGHGYWLVASDGGIFAFGDARFFGSTGAITLNKPIVGMTSTPSGHGYWLVASDGGIFAFGDAAFRGSTGAISLNRPVVGIASTPTGHGYWMVASDGGIFSFGDAHFFGSTGALVLNMPIVGMATTPTGRGYWFVAADGGIFSFGNAHFFGAARAQGLNQAIVGMAASAPRIAAALPFATKLAFTTQPGATASGGTMFTRQPVVTVQDASGATVSGDTSSVRLRITSAAGAVLSCTSTTKATVAGVAKFAGCKINTAGTYTLTATDGALASARSSSVVVTVGPAAQMSFIDQPSDAPSLVGFATQPSVAVQDLGGNTVASVNTGDVTLSISAPNTPGAALICVALSSPYVNGVATFSGCGIDRSGTHRLHAADLAFSANSDPVTITAAAADHLLFSQQPSPAGSTGGIAFAVQPTVSVVDASNNVVTEDNSSVTLAITPISDPPDAVLSCGASVNQVVVAGVATFSNCQIDLASATTYTLDAIDGGLTLAVSNPVDIDVGPAAQLGFVAQPSSSTGGIVLSTQPRVAVQDAGGNTVTSATGTITVSLFQPAPAGAALTCTTGNTRALTAGVTPAFDGCAVDLKSATTYTMRATDSAPGAFVGTSDAFTITTGAAAKLGFITQPTSSTGGITFPTQPRVAVQDAGGNIVTSDASPVTLDITRPSSPVGANLTCTSPNPRTPVAGIATFIGCRIDLTSGSYTLAATVTTGLTAATSSLLAIAVGVVSQIVFSTQPSASTVHGVAFAQQPVVMVKDAGGNTVTTNNTSSVTLGLTQPTTPAGAVMTCSSNTITVVSGVGTFAGCSIDTASSYTLTANDTTDAKTRVTGTVTIT